MADVKSLPSDRGPPTQKPQQGTALKGDKALAGEGQRPREELTPGPEPLVRGFQQGGHFYLMKSFKVMTLSLNCLVGPLMEQGGEGGGHDKCPKEKLTAS